MNVLLLSTFDITGGAARSAYRLHQGLQSIGVKSQMLVQDKFSDDRAITGPSTRLGESLAKTRVAWDALPLKFYRQRDNSTFSAQWVPDRIIPKINHLAPDLINLHWLGEAFIQVETIAKFNRPMVWTLHDMWAFTGGCHYNQDCDRYTDSCGACPQLHSSKNWDLSHWVWQRKAKAWKDQNLTIVCPSSWLAEGARASSLFKNRQVEVIPYGLDTAKYKPIDKQVARKLLNLPQDKQLVLFGSIWATSVKRKGFHLLQPALQDLSKAQWQDRVELAIFGSSAPENPPDLGFPVHYLGMLNDELSLSLVYSAADVFVLPSIQDNLPNTVLEALACGTPCVTFKIGGMPDMIEHQKNGYLAQAYKIEDLAQGIAWVLENYDRHQKLSHHAREKAEKEFALEIQAHRYLSLYTDILSASDRQKHNFRSV